MATTGTITRVPSSTTLTTLAISDSGRFGMVLFNDSTKVAYVAFSNNADMDSNYTRKIGPGGCWTFEAPVYQGVITCVWEAVNGAMQVTRY